MGEQDSDNSKSPAKHTAGVTVRAILGVSFSAMAYLGFLGVFPDRITVPTAPPIHKSVR